MLLVVFWLFGCSSAVGGDSVVSTKKGVSVGY